MNDDIRQQLNLLLQQMTQLQSQNIQTLGRIALLEDEDDLPWPRAESGADEFQHPLQVYVSGGYVCVRQGYHLWWNSYTSALATSSVEKTSGDAFHAVGTAVAVYVQRIYNADGTTQTITIEKETATPTVAGVMAGVTNLKARWVLATVDADGVVTQRWTGGDLYELRVA